MTTRPTMSTLATDLGLSPSTISRALRGDRRIGADTRARVAEAAQRLGYRPNPLVSALMASRKKAGGQGEVDTIALVTDYRENALPSSTPATRKGRGSSRNRDNGSGTYPSGAGAIPGWKNKDVCLWEYEGICRRAAELGFRVEEFPLADYGYDGGRLIRTLSARGIRGVLLGFSRGDDSDTPVRLDLSGFSVAGLSTYFREFEVDRANFHGLYNVQLALSEMNALGYHRTGVVFPEFNNRVSGYLWSSGVLDWQRRLPQESQRCTPFVADDEKPLPTAEREFNHWLDTERPDSIITYKLPIKSWLAKRGLRVPEDLGLAYLYRTKEEMNEAAGIDGNLQLVGAAAFDLVVEALYTNRTGLPGTPKEVLIRGVWKHTNVSLSRHHSTFGF